MTQTEERDPLAGYDSVPSISFDPSKPEGIKEGEWSNLVVNDYIKLVQAKDDKGQLKFWEDSGKPIMKAVLSVLRDGEERALWCDVIRKHDTALFAQLVAAQKQLVQESGDPARRLGPGDKIAVKWEWNTALPKKMGNHPKKYEVRVQAGTAPATPKEDPLSGGDPWSSTPPASPNNEPPFHNRMGQGFAFGTEIAI